jgi:hypothetical protein
MVSLPYALFIIFDDERSLDTFASLVIPVYRAYQRGRGQGGRIRLGLKFKGCLHLF